METSWKEFHLWEQGGIPTVVTATATDVTATVRTGTVSGTGVVTGIVSGTGLWPETRGSAPTYSGLWPESRASAPTYSGLWPESQYCTDARRNLRTT